MSDEEKEAIEILKLYFGDNPTLNITKYVNIVLNLIEKQSKEIEELKIIADKYEDLKILYEDNICELEKQQKEIEELNKENLEIRDWKYVIDSPIDLDKLKELDLIKIKGKEYVSKDKLIELREIDNIDLIQCKLRKLLEE